MAEKSPFGMSVNEDKLAKSNQGDMYNYPNDLDAVFAQLTDMFGELIPSDVILNVCVKYRWDLTTCIDNLINLDDTSRDQLKNDKSTVIKNNYSGIMNSTGKNSSALESLKIAYVTDSDAEKDADIVIESENLEETQNIDVTPGINNQPPINLGAIKKQKTTEQILDLNYVDKFKLLPSIPTISALNTKTEMSSNDNQMYSTFLKQNNNVFSFPEPGSQTRVSDNVMQIKLPANFEKIIHLINQGIKIMILMRGISGSGKSYLSRQIIERTMKNDYGNHIFSTDDYFYNANNIYLFQPNKLQEAHEFNQRRVEKRAMDGWSPIIVDNTNIQVWEMFPYCKLAAQYGYFIEILEPTTPWSWSPGKLALKNTHNVPKYTIEKMIQNYEKISVYNLLKAQRLEFHIEISPQMRKYPIFVNNTIDATQITNDKKNNTITDSSAVINHHSKDNILSTQQVDEVWNLIIDEPTVSVNSNSTLPKPQRSNSLVKNSESENEIEVLPDDQPLEISDLIDWTSHEHDNFWEPKVTSDDELTAKTSTNEPKSQRTILKPMDITGLNLVSLLKDNAVKMKDTFEEAAKICPPPPSPTKEQIIDLKKHKIGCENENNSFSQIRQIYPNVPTEYLWDLFTNCKGDGDWTMDILLKDDPKMNFKNANKKINNNKSFTCNCGSYKSDQVPCMPSLFQCSDNIKKDSIQEIINSSHQRPKKEKPILSDDILQVKRKFEENFVISDEHYSKSIRKARDYRRGLQAASSSEEMQSGNANDDEFHLTSDYIPEHVQFTDGETSSETDSDEIMEVSLGIDFVNQLDSVFGIDTIPSINDYEKLKTNVFMPKSLAKQLYALWLESLYNQFDEQRQQSIKEDEEFAKALQSQQKQPELSNYENPKTLKEIMEMEYAWAAYKSEINEWKNQTPQDLASKLTRDKLYAIFPNVDREILLEVLTAHNNKFFETMDVLRDSLKCNINDKIATDSNDLFAQAKHETEIIDNVGTPVKTCVKQTASTQSIEETKRSVLRDFEEYRNQAMHHTKLKNECFNKAHEAIQKGETSVAVYYSQIANLHKNKLDMYNHKAANCISEVHNLTQNNPDMLDLHYLRVAEAIECLDIFLDKHLPKIKASPRNYKDVFVITGRGLHSVGGIPTIKYKVKIRLKDRNLKCSEVNPGLLKVRIYANSKYSKNCTKSPDIYTN